MSTTTIQRTIRIDALSCGACGVWFGMEATHLDKVQNDGSWFYCPNGHHIHYMESELTKTQKELEQAKSRLERERRRLTNETDARRSAERSASALRGVVTRTKHRVGNGVCPCCKRTLKDLARHMASQHPHYADGSS